MIKCGCDKSKRGTAKFVPGLRRILTGRISTSKDIEWNINDWKNIVIRVRGGRPNLSRIEKNIDRENIYGKNINPKEYKMEEYQPKLILNGTFVTSRTDRETGCRGL